MNWKAFEKTEAYMLSCMNDSAHDKEHIYRVLYTALDIAAYEQEVDYEILITACLLHDIGRGEQFENPALCHAAVGGDKAFAFLMDCGWTQERARLVKEAIAAHRYRSKNPPVSVDDGKLKYVWNFHNGKEQLFDLVKDPGELVDCSANSKYGKQLKELREEMVKHLSERGDEFVKDGKLMTLEKTVLYSPNFPQK